MRTRFGFYLLLVFTLLGSYLGIVPTHGVFTIPGEVCVNNASPIDCPVSLASAQITGGFGTSVTISVNVVLGTDQFNAFDIRLRADPGILNASGVDLSGSVLFVDSSTLKAECVNGVGLGCVSPLDGPGIVRVSVNDTGTQSNGSSGRLFAVSYRVAGLATDSLIDFQVGCGRTSSGLCMSLTHPFNCVSTCTTVASENPVPGIFGNLAVLFPGYMVVVEPSLRFDSSTNMLSGTVSVLVANDTDGTVLFSKIFSVSLKVGSTGTAGFLLVAPISPAPLAVALKVDTTVNSVTGLVSGNPDVRNTGRIGIVDLASVAVAYGSSSGSPRYNLALDFNQDGVINVLDLALVAVCFTEPVFT